MRVGRDRVVRRLSGLAERTLTIASATGEVLGREGVARRGRTVTQVVVEASE